MDDLEALFESFDGFKEDLMDFGVAGLGAVGANLAWSYVDEQLVSKLPYVSESPVARAVLTVLAGVAGGAALARWNKNLATGVAVGLSARGIAALLQKVAPQLPVQGLSNIRYLADGISGASTMVEEVSGLGAATQTIEEVSGFGAATQTIEEVNGLNGVAATFQ